jgi:hypothetical protein
MVSLIKNEVREIERRAAEVRDRWSPLERLRRTGLPPDIPAGLREFLFRPNWRPSFSTIPARANRSTR